MKVIIAGGREFDNYPMLHAEVRMLLIHRGNWRYNDLEIVQGGARGADALGSEFASAWAIPEKVFPADWDQYGKAAGHIRNSEMADYADMLVAFWDGKSTGTKSMIDKAMKAGLETHVYRY